MTVAKRVLTSLDHGLRLAERNKKRVIETWSRLSTQLGQRVALSYNGKRFTGNCRLVTSTPIGASQNLAFPPNFI